MENQGLLRQRAALRRHFYADWDDSKPGHLPLGLDVGSVLSMRKEKEDMMHSAVLP